MDGEKKWEWIRFRIRGEQKKQAMKDAEKEYGEKGKLSELLRRLLKEHHEKAEK